MIIRFPYICTKGQQNPPGWFQHCKEDKARPPRNVQVRISFVLRISWLDSSAKKTCQRAENVGFRWWASSKSLQCFVHLLVSVPSGVTTVGTETPSHWEPGHWGESQTLRWTGGLVFIIFFFLIVLCMFMFTWRCSAVRQFFTASVGGPDASHLQVFSSVRPRSLDSGFLRPLVWTLSALRPRIWSASESKSNSYLLKSIQNVCVGFC